MLLPEGQIPEKNLSHGSQLEEAGVKPTATVSVNKKKPCSHTGYAGCRENAKRSGV